MHHLRKNFLECVKTGMSDSKFTIGEYHIITTEIIKLFPVNIFMPVTKFHPLAILLFCKKRPFRSLVSSGVFSKKPVAKVGYFALRKKGREKIQIVR